jgi:hypothetical protein
MGSKEFHEWVEARNAKKRLQHAARVEFLAIKNEVASYIEEGHSLQIVWEYFSEKGAIRCQYGAFRKHVVRYIKNAPTKQQGPTQGGNDLPTPSSNQSQPQTKENKTTTETQDDVPQSHRPPLTTMKSFTYNPETQKKEDLI